MNKSLFIITLNLLFNLCFSQNLVKNHSFEEGSCTPDDSYNSGSSSGYLFNTCLNHWQHCGTRQPLTSHSPDWFSAPAFGGAQDGNRFVHMVPYEAIQQKLSNELVEGSFYWVSVWVKLNTLYGEDFSTAALNVYLAGSGLLGNSRFEYQSDPNNPSFNPCDPDYRQLNANNKTLVKQIDLSIYPLEEWIQIHFIYEHKGSSKRDIVAFELIDTQADNKVIGCQSTSICLDNIEIMDPCSHPCIPVLGSFEHLPTTEETGVQIFNNYVRITQNHSFLFAIIENANYGVLRIYNRIGGEIFTRHYFDPNGLMNHNDQNLPHLKIFAFAWNGENNNGDVVQDGTYTYSLWFKNCSGQISPYYLGEVEFFSTNFPPSQFYPLPRVMSEINVGCCLNGSLAIDGQVSAAYRIHYSDNVITSDNAEFSGNEIQMIKAGEFVDLLPNTTILTNGFEAEISACFANLNLGKTDGFNTVDNHQYWNEINIYPNPTSDFVRIESSGKELTTIRVLSIQGAVLFTEKFKANDYLLDMVKYKPGLYIIQLTDLLGDIHTYKIIRQ